jgi:hypothetical protein
MIYGCGCKPPRIQSSPVLKPQYNHGCNKLTTTEHAFVSAPHCRPFRPSADEVVYTDTSCEVCHLLLLEAGFENFIAMIVAVGANPL